MFKTDCCFFPMHYVAVIKQKALSIQCQGPKEGMEEGGDEGMGREGEVAGKRK